jgi:hypothetical protein
MNVSMGNDLSKYVHFKSARLHQENDRGNTNKERQATYSDAVGG